MSASDGQSTDNAPASRAVSSRPAHAGAVLVGAIQMRPQIGKLEANVELTLSLLDRAFASGVRLAVLPELSTSGYTFRDIEEARRSSEAVGGGIACRSWIELCRRYDTYVVAGLLEQEDEALYNAAVLLGPEGLIGRYRKVHLWAKEKELYSLGDLGFPVYDTPIGRIGMAICYDAWFPETIRSLALSGADIVCMPTNWVPVPGQPPHYPLLAHMLVMTAAHSNALYVVAADRYGLERGQRFLGQSLIVDHTGWPLAGPAPVDRAALLVSKLYPVESRPERWGRAFNNPLGERRPEMYQALSTAHDESSGKQVGGRCAS